MADALLDNREDVAARDRGALGDVRDVTLPARWATISFSIFIASITQIRSPSATSAPCSTATLQHGALQRRGQGLAGGAAGAAGLALALRWLLAARRGRGAAGHGLADHLDVEELAGDLDLVVAGHDLGPLLRRRRGGGLAARSSSATRGLPSGRGRSRLPPTARWRARPCGRGSAWSGRRSRTRPGPAACAASRARGRRPRRSAWRPSGHTSASPRSRPRPRSRRGRRGPPARGRS